MRLENILIAYAKPTSKVEKSTLEIVKNTLKKHKISFNISKREKLTKKLFQNKDLIIAVGGDGTFLRASHFIFDQTPVLGVNSDPKYKEGFYMVTDKSNFQKKIKKILGSNYTMKISRNFQGLNKFKQIKKFHRLEAYINNKKIKERALNEFYIASEKDYHTARYFLNVRGKKERQKSSGVLIATPSGSNAWIKSAGGKILPLNTNKFEYLVREPYCGKISAKCTLVNNVLNNNEKIEIIFEVGNGIVIADSLSKEHKFKAGQKVTVKMSNNPLYFIS